MKFTVVVGNYNCARWVGGAIESALRQPDTQVIVVDDGSTDGSRAVIQGYADRAELVFQANRGQGGVYNEGWRRATGELVLFLDSDDLLSEGALAQAAVAWRPGTAKVQWQLQAIDARGRRLGRSPAQLSLPSGGLARHLGIWGYYPSPAGSGASYHRSYLSQVLPLEESQWRLCADGYLHGPAPLFGDVRYIPKALGTYRVHGQNRAALSPNSLESLARYAAWQEQVRTTITAHCQSAKMPAPRRYHPQFRRLQLVLACLGAAPQQSLSAGQLAELGLGEAMDYPLLRPRERGGLLALFGGIRFAPPAIRSPLAARVIPRGW